jgi:signal transduction histidine kinase
MTFPILLRIEDAEGGRVLNRAWLEFTGEPAQDALLAQGWLSHTSTRTTCRYLQRPGSTREASALRGGCAAAPRRRALPMDAHEGRRCDDQGQLLGYVSVSVDIEERKLAEQALAQASARKDEFLAMLAHELRNPLAPIGNALQCS